MVRYEKLDGGLVRVISERLGIDVVIEGKDPVLTKSGLLGPRPKNGYVRGVFLYEPLLPNRKGEKLYGQIAVGKGIHVREAIDNMQEEKRRTEIRELRRSLIDSFGSGD